MLKIAKFWEDWEKEKSKYVGSVEGKKFGVQKKAESLKNGKKKSFSLGNWEREI